MNLWTSVASALKVYPNVLFELWNEPNSLNAGDEAVWFQTVQQCITAIRNTAEASNIIVVQWNYVMTLSTPLDWISAYPLSDSLNNFIYSTHLYYQYLSPPPNTMQEVISQYTTAGLFSSSLPIIVGEIGCRVADDGSFGTTLTPTDFANELVWFNNSLTVLVEHQVGFLVWAAPPYYQVDPWQLTTADNYVPNAAGQIVINHFRTMARTPQQGLFVYTFIYVYDT